MYYLSLLQLSDTQVVFNFYHWVLSRSIRVFSISKILLAVKYQERGFESLLIYIFKVRMKKEK